jgi:hypothetical protein
MTTELLTWTPVAERLPDDDTTVLICTTDTAEPVWLGYRDGDDWRDSEGDAVAVTHWAAMPVGVVQQATR